MTGGAVVPTVVLIFAFAGLLPAQRSTTPAEFEVATLKRSPPPPGDRIVIDLGTVRNGRLTLSNASLSDCLRFAYGLVSDAQLAGPDWIKSKEVRFDIVAQAPAGTAREQFAKMLQPLLAERLKLSFHYEPKELSYLALAPVKGGPKLVATRDPQAPSLGPSIPGHIASEHLSMLQLATLLSRFLRETVIDSTGLSGDYQVKLEWTPELDRSIAAGTNGAELPGGTVAEAPSLFTAIQQQLGLRLERRKGPVNVLVVGHAEQTPAEN